MNATNVNAMIITVLNYAIYENLWTGMTLLVFANAQDMTILKKSLLFWSELFEIDWFFGNLILFHLNECSLLQYYLKLWQLSYEGGYKQSPRLYTHNKFMFVYKLILQKTFTYVKLLILYM